MASPPRPARPRGRPRSADVDAAILDAAAALLGEVGYSAMSMEAVAARAGVAKPTVYLRYAGKAELVAAAFERLRMGGAPALSGDLRTDLVAQLRHLRSVFDRVGMSLTGVCLAEAEHLPDLIAALRERSLHPGRRLLRDALEAARDRGGIAEDADVATAVEMCVGAYYARHLAGDPFDPGWEERVADATLRAVGARPSS
ncbi:TetR/AcrR family transcriptional regulator [Miltoncostaea oceani]|jgi:AcrR family transcriptional regulator|uniref:TetR/AcrR family transcriptional regulator n=1 Tax=Miltoncostaea oceani TaxID=2843216 RepID=UPI001C3CB775|nr:TetR/AcrR family transcriptional regulator [Miltoncostaea oceani]